MRLIDADALKQKWLFSATGDTEMLKAIDNAPTIDAVQVVRCKECKHSQYDVLFRMRWCHGNEVNDDDYCSYGERKDDEID